jgi:hypothetical protein
MNIINLFKMEWEIFQFLDSVAVSNMNNIEIDKKIKIIKKKYLAK